MATVAAPVTVTGKTPFPIPNKRFPVVFNLCVRQCGVSLVQNILDADDLIHLGLGDVDGLPLLKVVDHGAVSQVEPVGHAAGTIKERMFLVLVSQIYFSYSYLSLSMVVTVESVLIFLMML